ncbi:signal peptidase I [Streptomyces sp. NPDC051940]|uniref:signal peptidase I n=1 Tax=Streptomyces sp. NPDC051940 TaxID=3155675 RepID=UPI0034236A3C
MDTHAQLSERDGASSSDSSAPAGDDGREGPSRSSRFPALARLAASPRLVRTGRMLRPVGALTAVCLVTMLLVSTFVVQPFLIPSGSMKGTLRPGDRILVNKLAYRFGGEPRRGDVVVFDGSGSFSDETGASNPVTRLLRKAGASVGLAEPVETDFVKRVIGVGGDRVTCCDARGRLMVNGVAIDESGYLYPGDTPSRVPFDIVVPEGRLWVMGDHRSDSRDSRDHLGAPGGGTVPVDKVIGRADWIGWPAGRWASIGRPSYG